jgi:hypothetical protein
MIFVLTKRLKFKPPVYEKSIYTLATALLITGTTLPCKENTENKIEELRLLLMMKAIP